MPEFIKQIQVGNTLYDINAYAIQDSEGNPKNWTDITSLVQAGFTILTAWSKSDYESQSAPSASVLAGVPEGILVYYASGEYSTDDGTLAAATEETKRHIYLVYHPHQDGKDCFDEYVSGGQGASSFWEKIGNTDIDLSNYPTYNEAAKPGTYTTTAASGNTGAAGAATITTSSSDAYTATGTATVTYDKANAATGSAGAIGTSANTGKAGGATINGSDFSFTGTTATISLEGDYQPEGSISGSQSVSAHSHTVNVATATTTIVTGVDASTGADGEHTHTVTTHSHASAETVVKSLSTATISSLTNGGSASLTSNYGFATSTITDVMYNPTVSNSVLSWNTATPSTSSTLAFTPASGTTATVVTGISATASVAGASSVATLTTSSDGEHSHTVGKSTATLTYVSGATLSTAGAFTINGSNFTFTGTTATIGVSGSYQPAGSIGGSSTIAEHSHSYTAPADHTHSISYTTTTVTAGVEVAVGAHSHTVTIADHTHSLNNHTHSVTIPPIVEP